MLKIIHNIRSGRPGIWAGWLWDLSCQLNCVSLHLAIELLSWHELPSSSLHLQSSLLYTSNAPLVFFWLTFSWYMFFSPFTFPCVCPYVLELPLLNISIVSSLWPFLCFSGKKLMTSSLCSGRVGCTFLFVSPLSLFPSFLVSFEFF